MHCAKYLLLEILTLLFLVLSPTVLAGEEPYYTWVDEDGVTNYSQRNPRNVDAAFVSQSQPFGVKKGPPRRGSRPGQNPAGEDSANSAPEPDEEMDREERAIREEIARIRASNCSIGKRTLAKLQAYSRIRVRDSDGGERILTEEEKQQRKESAERTIQENCGAA